MSALAERCHECDRALATDADYDESVRHGGDACSCKICSSLCWRAWNCDTCYGDPVDWRSLALELQSKLTASVRAGEAKT